MKLLYSRVSYRFLVFHINFLIFASLPFSHSSRKKRVTVGIAIPLQMSLTKVDNHHSPYFAPWLVFRLEQSPTLDGNTYSGVNLIKHLQVYPLFWRLKTITTVANILLN